MEGQTERIWITDIAADGIHLVGHTKGYIQVLVDAPETLLGASAKVRITSVGRWSVFGELIEVLNPCTHETTPDKSKSSLNKCSPCATNHESCACSDQPHSCCSAVPLSGNSGKPS